MDTTTLTTLPDISNQINSSHTLLLNTASLGDETFQKFQQYLLTEEVTLQNCSVTSSQAGQLLFTGTFPSLFSLPSVNASFLIFDVAVVEDEATVYNRNLILLLDWPANYTPELLLANYTTVIPPQNLFYIAGVVPLFDTAFTVPHFLFSTTGDLTGLQNYPAPFLAFRPAAQVTEGQYFQLTASVDPAMATVLNALSIPSSIAFEALVENNNELILTLNHSLSVSAGLSPFSLSLNSISLAFSIANLGQTVPSFTILGNLNFGIGTADIEADLDLVYNRISFLLEDIQVPIPSLQDFANKFGVSSFDGLLPGSMPDYGNIYATFLKASIQLEGLYVEEISWQFTSEKPIGLIDDVVSFTPWLTTTISAPFDTPNRAIETSLWGEWLLGNTIFDLQLSYPDFNIYSCLRAGYSIDINDLATAVFRGIALPDIIISDLEMEGSFNDKSFDADVDIVSDWQFTLGGAQFGMTDLEMSVSYAAQQISACEIHGALELFSMNIDASATYDTADGWFIEGGITPGEVIVLSTLLQNILSTFSQTAADTSNILDEVLDVNIDSLFIQYQVKTGALSVYSDLNNLLHISDKFSINNVLIKIYIQDKTIQGSCIIKMTLAGIDFFLESAKESDAWIFSGGTPPGVSVPIGLLGADVLNYFSVNLPNVISDVTLSNIYLSYNDSTKDFTFVCDGTIPFSSGKADIHLNIALIQSQGNYTKKIDGKLIIDQKDFTFSLTDNDTALSFLATFQQKGSSINVQSAVSALSSDLAVLIPSSFTLGIDNSEIAIYKDSSGTSYLLGLGLGISADLTNIPVIGSELDDGSLLLDDLQIYFSSRTFSKDQIALFGSTLLPVDGMEKGFLVSSDLVIGGTKTSIQLPVASDSNASAAQPATPGSLPATASATASSQVKWWVLQCNVGPVTFERIGVKYQDGTLWFLLDVKLTTGGLTLSLDGLAAGSPLSNFDLQFHLDGLGIDYSNGPVSIGGALLSVTPDPSTGATFQYDGEVIIQTEAITLAAIGSYSNPGGKPSLFIFAEVDKEFGGPPYFFVTGLTAGFGYNSKVNLPDINHVVDFPFVTGLQGQTDPLQVLNILEGKQGGTVWVEAQPGTDWLSFGLQFTSFELVKSRALLMAEFGQEFELALLGISKVQLPQEGTTQYAYVEMGLEARFLPEEGFCGVSAVISKNSYVITPDCKLTGGFALYTWFGSSQYAGDFVITAGGYHPSFTKPSWYPDVERLGFNWNVNDNVTISGEAYFALTPSCVMGGGGLQVLFHDGNLKAWLTAYADFLIYWKPFHFYVEMGVSIGVSYKIDFLFVSKTFSIELGASLSIWGPPTAGKVHIDWYIISFTVHFGEGDNSDQSDLDWDGFKTLLPAKEDICKIAVNNGLHNMAPDTTQNDGSKRWIVRADEFEFTTQSAIPATAIHTATPDTKNNTLRSTLSDPGSLLNIRPMGKQGVNSSHLVTITDPLNQVIDLDAHGWQVEVVTGSVPESLWGAPLDNPPPPSANVIPGKNSGLRIKAPAAILGATPGPINMENDLSYEPLEPEGVLSLSINLPSDPWVPQYSSPTKSTVSTIVATIADPGVKQKRDALIGLLNTSQLYAGPNDPLDLLSQTSGDIYTDEPLLASLSN